MKRNENNNKTRDTQKYENATFVANFWRDAKIRSRI